MNFRKQPVILASASPRRKELLGLAGMEATVLPSTLEEHADTPDPKLLVAILSRQKALDVGKRFCDGEIVIGADTCVHVPDRHGADLSLMPSARTDLRGGAILGKPRSHEEAVRMIRILSGNIHQVYTSVTLLRCFNEDNLFSGKRAEKGGLPLMRCFTEKTVVHVAPMSENEITDYAMSDEPMDKAGAYGIQGAFCRFIGHIEGDYFNVMGLPVAKLYHELKHF